jgi:hypothetical protein
MSTRTQPRRTRRPVKTKEQRDAEARALHDTLTAQVQTLTESGGWRRYLDFLKSFHTYSLANVLLILAQRPDATLVAGFRAWQVKGRQVRKGERSIRIRGYSTRKVTDTDPDTGDEVERTLARFPILSVFDVSQTDPIPGADTPTSPATRLTGDDPAGIYQAIADHLTGLGWTVTRQPIAGEANGYTSTDGTRRILVDDQLTPAQAAKTMLHEAAHAVLHVDADTGQGDRTAYVAHRGRCETEAESVAYVLAGLADLDTSAYSVGYVTSWADGDVDLVRQTADNVLRAVHQLAPALLDEPADPDHHSHHNHRHDHEDQDDGAPAA